MLDLDAIDLDMLAEAMRGGDDYDSGWWFDPRTGEVIFWSRDAEHQTGETEEALEDRGAIRVGHVDQRDAWRDMRDFVATVEDERAR